MGKSSNPQCLPSFRSLDTNHSYSSRYFTAKPSAIPYRNTEKFLALSAMSPSSTAN